MTKQVKLKPGVKTIPMDEDVAEWRKSPSYMREYERQKPEFDRLRRQIDRRLARREWRATQLARVREFWAMCWRYGTGLCRWLVRGHDPVTT